MKWTFHPTNKKLTTSLPLSIEVEGFSGEPTVTLSEVGRLELKKVSEGKLRSDFYVGLEGKYILTVKDSKETVHIPLDIAQHRYINFTNEFGSFFLLFLVVMGGIILWTRKIMKYKTRKT